MPAFNDQVFLTHFAVSSAAADQSGRFNLGAGAGSLIILGLGIAALAFVRKRKAK